MPTHFSVFQRRRLSSHSELLKRLDIIRNACAFTNESQRETRRWSERVGCGGWGILSDNSAGNLRQCDMPNSCAARILGWNESSVDLPMCGPPPPPPTHSLVCIYLRFLLSPLLYIFYILFLPLSLSLFLCALENYLYTWLWGHGHLIFIYKYLKASRPSPCLAFTQLFFRYSVSIFHSTRGSRLNSLRRVRRLIGQEMEQTLPSQSQIWFVAETVSDQVREWVFCTRVITIKHMASNKKSGEEEILIYRDGGGVFVYLQSR